jgi:hypothetical protein
MDLRNLLITATSALVITSCISTKPVSEVKDIPSVTRAGYTDLMKIERVRAFKKIIPSVDNPALQAIMNSPDTMYYDKKSMVPGYQDSMGDPEGMRPNTIAKSAIDTAVRGGHNRLFKKKGQFHFPYGTGGVDDSTNVSNINFWSPPKEDGKVLPVVYWITSYSRWEWYFPIGTVIGEILFVEDESKEKSVFEIRTRTRTAKGWDNDIYRPFSAATELASAIKSRRPNYTNNEHLSVLVNHLEDNTNLEQKTLVNSRYKGVDGNISSVTKIEGHIDTLPPFGDKLLVKELLRTVVFKSVRDKEWKRDGEKVAFAPNTKQTFGITANNYNGGLFEVSEQFCSQCHTDAGRSIDHFAPDLAAYGELWGEDETFSWHLFENSRFAKPNGDVKCFNADRVAGCRVDDNRAIRQTFIDSGLVVRYKENIQENLNYKRLPRSWKVKPF